MRPQYNKNPQMCAKCPRYTQKQCLPSDLPPRGADVLILSEQPGMFSAENNETMYEQSGKIVTRAILELLKIDYYKDIKVRYSYSVWCQPVIDDKAPTKREMDLCLPLVNSAIDITKPKVIIALGATAMKQLGVKAKHGSVRGKLLERDIPAMITFSEKALLANPGLYNTFQLDVKNAFDYVLRGEQSSKSIEELSKDYLLPNTMNDALAACDHILNYSRAGKEKSSWPIAVDTETTSLHAELDTSKIIAFCFAWDKGKSATIIYDHPHADPEYLARLPELREKIDKILSSNKPKIYHNAKFDLKFTDFRYGFTTRNVAWDTLLGEHLIDEDKKGNYGLKALTSGWLPDYSGYEDQLWDVLKNEEVNDVSQKVRDEIDSLQGIITEDHKWYLGALATYSKEHESYERLQLEFEDQYEDYLVALFAYNRAKVAHQYLLAGWEMALKKHTAHIEAWKLSPPKERGRKPKKPLKPRKWWARKPTKPKAPKRPKKPKDPRSKKEKKVFSDAGFEKVPMDKLQLYGAIDTDVTRQLSIIQLKRIKMESSKVKPLMRSHAVPASYTLGKMEHVGTRIDVEYLNVLEERLRETVSTLEEEIYQMSGTKRPDGKDLNLHGPDLGEVIYNWGWAHPDGTMMPSAPVLERTASGQASRAARVLRQHLEYEDDGLTPTPSSYFIERWLTYSKAHKALNTFVANIRVLSRRTGRLHTSFHINGTGTGRLSSSDMNLQNIPKYLAGHNIKKLFVPTNDDQVFVNADYSGAEVRVFTAYARDEKLIEALNNGLNMHSFFASKVFNNPYEDYQNRDNPEALPDAAYRKQLDRERQNIKRVVFGILYGAGPRKIAESINVGLQEARALIDMLFNMFPAIRSYIRQIDAEVGRQRWVETLFGRRRRFPLAHMKRHYGRATRQARNFKIQSTSSDIVLAQLIEIDKELKYHYRGEARMLLTVHDSLGIEFPKKYVHELEGFLLKYGQQRVNEKFPWLPVPFVMDIECGPSYGECMPVARYMQEFPFVPKYEGVIEEQEILTELRDDAYEGAA